MFDAVEHDAQQVLSVLAFAKLTPGWTRVTGTAHFQTCLMLGSFALAQKGHKLL
jgi:hypothetical protein